MDNRILIKHGFGWGLNEKMVSDLAKEVLKELGYEKDVELSILFVGREKARKLNQEYRKKSYVPEVLGFPMSKEKDSEGVIRLGDVVVCTEKLRYEMKTQKKTAKEVLREWFVHEIKNLLL